jgi:hypothetical protein
MTNITTPTFPAVVFSVTDAGIAELEAKHRGLVVAHGDKKGYLALTQAIAEVRTARTDVEKRRKELKQDALDYGRLVDSTAKSRGEQSGVGITIRSSSLNSTDEAGFSSSTLRTSANKSPVRNGTVTKWPGAMVVRYASGTRYVSRSIARGVRLSGMTWANTEVYSKVNWPTR